MIQKEKQKPLKCKKKHSKHKKRDKIEKIQKKLKNKVQVSKTNREKNTKVMNFIPQSLQLLREHGF